MEPVSITIATYVSLKFIDQFLKEEGYGRLKKFLFPEKKYKTKLISIIYKTIEEHEKFYPYQKSGTPFPFYHSQILFDDLNKFVLFESHPIDYENIIKKLEDNENIIIPSSKELESFYELFILNINASKTLKKLHFDENYKSKIFQLVEDLSRIETKLDSVVKKVTTIESSLLFNPDNKWFTDQCSSSIIDLGKRYTPKLNFELEISNIFDGLGRTLKFKKMVTSKVDELLIKGRKILTRKEECKDLIESLEKYFEDLHNLFLKLDFENQIQFPFDEFITIVDSIENTTNDLKAIYLNEERSLQKEKKDYQHYHKHGYEIANVRDFENSIYDFRDFIESDICELANIPFLILDGEAGIGKSHMLGDIVSKRLENGYESVFLLGQHFTTDEDPWTQILKRLRLGISQDSFLNSLNERATIKKQRIIIFIDAINEGRGKYFWNDNVKSFISEVQKFEYLGLVLSVRTSYKNLILPADEIKTLDVIEHTLYGFRSNEYNASKLFFDNYSIQLPTVPLLHPEFQNPLFLKLFCEGINKSGQTKIPDGMHGITSIINFFINNVNYLLSKPNRYDYSNGINLVDKSISSLIQYKIDNDLRYVNYEKGIELIEDTVSKFVTKRGTFLDELISEGIFSKNLFWIEEDKYEEGIYLAYDRFEDHLLAKYLLEKFSDLEFEFNDKDGNLSKYVKEENDLYYNKGLIDAFTIQIPEIFGKELYEFLPRHKDKYPIVESFVESLLWRKMETIKETSKDYVNNYVFLYKGSHDLFWETIISIASIPGHYYNAYSLHNHLIKHSMPERDQYWTQLLKHKYHDETSVKRLIDWAWNDNDKIHISDESIKLSSIALAWFLTSTDRQLRDCSTKALVSLLQNRMHVLIDVLKLFENVNDPYVYERLFAVSYGCALRTSQNELLPQLSTYIFETIFKDKEEVYPHILLRDYARGVIEYTNYLKLDISFDIDMARPPYKSSFPKKILSNEEIDEKYKFDYNSDDYKKYYWSQNTILSSMATEYGRGIGGYGDFGRYTFQSALRVWQVNPNLLSNLAIEIIFEKYGYDVEKHGEYDNSLDYTGRKSSKVERIGKKYQWLAFYEILALVSDNFEKYDRYIEDGNEESYQGPWNPYVRDIDPTILIKETGGYDDDDTSNFWWSDNSIFDWECSSEDWVNKTDNLPTIEKLIEITNDKNDDWLVLEGYPEWSQPKRIGEEKWDHAHKRIWCHTRSYLVKEEEFDSLGESDFEDLSKKSLPESGERYELFNKEFFWSPAYKDIVNDGSENSDWIDIDTGKNTLISSVILPVEGYRWEEEFDKSKDDTISFLKPSSILFYGMGLKYSDREGELLDSNNDLVCIAPNVHYNSKSYLLIKKKPFLEFLKNNKLKIIWTIYGEKQIIGGRTFRDDYIGMMQYSGTYFLSENVLTGTLSTKKR